MYALPEHFEDASEFRDRPSKAVLAEVRAGDLLLVRHHDLSSYMMIIIVIVIVVISIIMPSGTQSTGAITGARDRH